jgi:arsenate reductase (thioredoxin)
MKNQTVKIAFICTGNSARSQMAEGLTRTFGNKQVVSQSAGTSPIGVASDAITAMAEIEIDISQQTSKGLDEIDNDLDYAITLCSHANRNCPVLPAKVRLHWPFPDPCDIFKNDSLEGFRLVRNELKLKIIAFLSELNLLGKN